MTQQPSPLIAQRNEGLLQRIQELKAENPFWGYLWIWACLRFIEQQPVSKKRVLRLMREHCLLINPRLRLKAKRTPMGSKAKPTTPSEWWGIGMMKVVVESFGWVYIGLVLDWYTKKIVGHYVAPQAQAAEWLMALDHAVNRQFPHDVQRHRLSLMGDNGSQHTSLLFMKACSTLSTRQAFTSYNYPKENADTERLMRTLKEELLWLREWTSPTEVERALTAWVDWYHTWYWHTTLDYRTPSAFEQHHQPSPDSQLVPA